MGSLDELASLDASAQVELVQRGDVAPDELVSAAIERIERLNPELHAVVTPMFEEARGVAKQGALKGAFRAVPLLLEDLHASYAGVRHTYGSAWMHDHVAAADSELVRRYKRAGLVILGKTNTAEFGVSPMAESRLFGDSRNPWSTDHFTGGSSGAAAAAVASGMVPMAHANDGGGSLRAAASCCGLFGLKPSRGRNPCGPDFAAPGVIEGSLQAHCVSRSVRDSAALLDGTAGPEGGDFHLTAAPDQRFVAELVLDPGPLRIAASAVSPLGGEVHPDCIDAVVDAAHLCESLGHKVVEADFCIDPESLTGVAGSAALTLFIDGIAARTGVPPSEERFEPLTWMLYQMGQGVSATDYLLEQIRMQDFARRFEAFMSDYDLWLTPTLALPPVSLDWLETERRLDQRMQRQVELSPFAFVANLVGRPAMSVPLYWNAAGLPIGAHFTGGPGDEATLLRLASQLEDERPWAQRRPPHFAMASPAPGSSGTRSAAAADRASNAGTP